jgi:cytochrome c oxidase subunit 3
MTSLASGSNPTSGTAPKPAERDPGHLPAAEAHHDARLFGLATFLVADGMTFAGFFAAYLTFRAVNPLPEGATYELELLLPTINTVLLLVSSVTFHRAGKNLLRGHNSASRTWLLVSAALGIAFLGARWWSTSPFPLASPTTSSPAPSMP